MGREAALSWAGGRREARGEAALTWAGGAGSWAGRPPAGERVRGQGSGVELGRGSGVVGREAALSWAGGRREAREEAALSWTGRWR